jgi:anti-sigma B factor antagonist
MEFMVNRNPDAGCAVIVCPKHLNTNKSQELKNILNDLVTRSFFRIILDLSGCRYVDSSGLGAIVSRIADLRARGGDVRVAGANDHVTGLFRLTNLDKIIRLFDVVDVAKRSFEEN